MMNRNNSHRQRVEHDGDAHDAEHHAVEVVDLTLKCDVVAARGLHDDADDLDHHRRGDRPADDLTLVYPAKAGHHRISGALGCRA